MSETTCKRCGTVARYTGTPGRCASCGEWLEALAEEPPAAVVVRPGPTPPRQQPAPDQRSPDPRPQPPPARGGTAPRQEPKTPAWLVWLAAALSLAIAAGVVLLVVFVFVPRYTGHNTARENQVKAGIQKIQTAVDAFRARNGAWPDGLDQLIQGGPGGPPLLQMKDLQDPWGIPYEYNPNRLDQTGRPMIRSIGQEMDGGRDFDKGGPVFPKDPEMWKK